MPSNRDPSQRKADLDWLYGATGSAKDHQQALNDAEEAELRRVAARKAEREASQKQQAAQQAARQQQEAARQKQEAARAEQARAAAARRPAAASSSVPVTPVPRPDRPGVSRPENSTKPNKPSATASTVVRGGRKPRPRWLKITGWVVAALAVWALWLGLVPMYSWSSMRQIDATPGGDRPAQQPGTAILLVGSDSRDNLTAAEKAKLGTGTDTGTRTDTMMILYVPPSGKSVLLSLPRDSYVPIPGHGHNKLNAAFSLGGPQLLMETIEQDTGLRMDGYLEIGMDGFANVIDSIGGIRMCLPTKMVDKDSHTNLPAGCQNLNGTQALGYVRMRKADPLGDLGRVKRQRQMIAAVANKATSFGTLANPVRYWKLNMAVRGALQRQGLGVFSMPGIASGLMDVSSGKGLQLTVPVSNADATTAAGSSVLWDHTKALELFHKLEAGDTTGLEQFQK